jgi:hypothetical protein
MAEKAHHDHREPSLSSDDPTTAHYDNEKHISNSPHAISGVDQQDSTLVASQAEENAVFRKVSTSAETYEYT